MSKTIALAMIAAAGLAAGPTVIAASKGINAPPTVFYVFLKDPGCNSDNCGVVVTSQSTWKTEQTAFDTCTKPAGNSNLCNTQSTSSLPTRPAANYTYVRSQAGEPWYIDEL